MLMINFLLIRFQVIEITNCTEQTDFRETDNHSVTWLSLTIWRLTATIWVVPHS